MGIVTDVTIQGCEITLGETLEGFPDTHVTFERVVPTGERLFPFMWAYTDNPPLLYQHLQRNSALESVRLVHHEGGEGLFELTWSDRTGGFLDCLERVDVSVLRAGGSNSTWEFELRFDTHADVSTFQQECASRDISLSVDRIVTESVVDPPGEKLTQPQRETIELALECGYFDVPRKTTMVELAEELGISDQAVSARIRRAMKKLSQQLFLPDTSPEIKQPNVPRP